MKKSYIVILDGTGRTSKGLAQYLNEKFNKDVEEGDVIAIRDRETFEEKLKDVHMAPWFELGDTDGWTRLALRKKFGPSILDKAIEETIDTLWPRV